MSRIVFLFQPAAEIIGFRMGELKGLSRWRARYQGIGLDEKLLDEATENAGLVLVQVQRFMMVLSSVVQQVQKRSALETINFLVIQNNICDMFPTRCPFQ